MSISEQQTAWVPTYFADTGSQPALGGKAQRRARWSLALALGIFAVLALASTVQAILAPELLGGIFERL